jgi:hypothetical protein
MYMLFEEDWSTIGTFSRNISILIKAIETYVSFGYSYKIFLDIKC